MNYVKLLDGGIIDNYGLSGLVLRREESNLPYAPYTPQQAVKLRDLLFVVVDAGQAVDASWVKTVKGPSGVQLVLASTNTALDAAKRVSFDLFTDTMDQWQQQLITYRCGLSKEEVLRLRGSLDGWDCHDLQFHIARVTFGLLPPEQGKPLSLLPTTLALPTDQVDALIAGGEQALKRSPEYQDFLRSIGATPQTASAVPVGAQPPVQ